MKYEALLSEVAGEVGGTVEESHAHAKALLERVAEGDPAEVGARVQELRGESLTWSVPGPEGRACLVVIGERGEDAERHWIGEEGLTVGREAELAYPEDEFISPEHVSLTWRWESLYARDQGSINGTYIKVRAPHELQHGDVFLMGRQVLKFVNLTREREERERDEPETRPIGSPAPSNVYALKQMGIGDEVYDMRRLGEVPVRLGREPEEVEGEESFGFDGDVFMSSNHARVAPRDGTWWLEDVGSGNGTWVQIREARRLVHEDHLFVGKQLFRVEFTEPGP